MTQLYSLQACSVAIDGKRILAPQSFEIAAGEAVTICGASGAGKSTLLQLLLGFYKPTEGTICYRGAAMDETVVQALRRESAVVFQEPVLGEGAVEEVLRAPFRYRHNRHRSLSRGAITAALDTVGLASLPLDQPVEKLSGGERQRVALVRALLLERPLLFLDEVTAALNAELRGRVRELLSARGCTLIAITHDRDWIAESSRVMTLTPPEATSANR